MIYKLLDFCFKLPVIKWFKPLYDNHKSIVMYLIFGTLTAMLNFILYTLSYNLINIPNTISTFLAWLLSSIYAYYVNKKYVFEISEKATIKGFISFLSSRGLTGILDVLIMWLFVDIFNYNASISKIVCSAITAVINYILGKIILSKVK